LLAALLLLLLTMPLEDAGDDAKGRLPNGHLVRQEVTRTLGHLKRCAAAAAGFVGGV
jgi:hypothetical protein